MLNAAEVKQMNNTAAALISNNCHGSRKAICVRPLRSTPQADAAPKRWNLSVAGLPLQRSSAGTSTQKPVSTAAA